MSDLELVRGSNGTGEAVRATVVGVRPTGSTILPVDSIMAWPSRFIATSGTLGPDGVTLDPASIQVFVGKINGSNIEVESFAPGYVDMGNTSGDIVVLKQTTEWANNLSDIVNDFDAKDTSLTETFKEMFGDGVVSGMDITYPPTGRIADISAGVAYIGAKRATVAVSSRTYTATRDTYIMLKDDGTLTYPDVAVGGAAPATPADSILIGKLTTDATKFTALQVFNRGIVKAQNVDFKTFEYSTTEQTVGTWIDGRVIYRKTISTGVVPNATSKLIPHGISGLKLVTDLYGTASSGSAQITLPYVIGSTLAADLAYQIDLTIQGANIRIRTGQNSSSYTESYVTICYTKD